MLSRVPPRRSPLCRELDVIDREVRQGRYRIEWGEDRSSAGWPRSTAPSRTVVRRFVAGQVNGEQAARLLAGLLPS
jgi:hypothetical protein